MPKVRSSSDVAMEFAISPWQLKRRRYIDQKQVQDASAICLGSEERMEADLYEVSKAIESCDDVMNSPRDAD